MKKLIALLTAAVATLTSAWAATPVAVWDGDFTIATKNGYTIDKNGNTNNGKNITISGATGMTVTGTGGQLVTVLVKAKYTPTQSSNTEALVAILNGDKAHVGVGGRKDSTELWGIWDGNQWSSNKTASDKRVEDTNSHKIAVTYTYTADLSQQNLQGTTIYYDGVKVHNWNGLRGGGVNIGSAAVIGGPKVTTSTNLKPATGMVIEGIAIFGTDATQADITGYTFPSETTMAAADYTVFSENPAVLTWAGTTATFHNGPWKLFDVATGTDGDQVTGSTVPGQSGDVTIWEIFSRTSGKKYVAPGYVLRLTKDATHVGNLDAQYTDLAFGGLIIEQGAQGYQFASSNSTKRETHLGDATKPNTLEIRESLVFNRTGVFKLYGTINANIAETKVLDLNYGQTTAANWPVLQSGATLKMLGKGNILVKTLDATAEGVTLDYSAQTVSRTAPYIDGTVKIGENTNIVLPADYVLGSAYTIATAIDDSVPVGTSYTKSVTIGETVHENAKIIVLANGQIAAFEGDINPAAGIFCLYDWTFVDSITSVGRDTLTLSWDTGFHDGQEHAGERFLTGESYTYGSALNAQATPYCPDNVNIAYPTEWTCFVAGIAPSNVGGGLIVFGTTNGGAIGLVTTAADEVSLVRTTGNSKYQTLAKMTVPGAQTTSHAYTFVKTASAITVYLDGNLWNQTAVANATFGNKLQVGSIHGGTGNTGIVKASSGSIQAVRIMEGVQSAATIRAFSNEFPYHSPNGTYGRTFEAGEQSWNAEEAWTSTKDEGNVAEPGAGLVQANFSGETTVSVNLAEDVTYESLTINNNESGTITFVAAKDSVGSIKAAQMNVNAPIVLGEGAVDLAQGPVTIGEEGSITFDFSGLPYAGAVAAYPFVEKVTGIVEQNDAKFILKAPAENDDFSLAIRYNEGNRYYEVAATYKNLVQVTIPEITGATASVSLGEKTVEVVEGKVTVPATANLTVTYTANTGYTMGATTVATLENAQEGSTVDTTGITAAINTYSVVVTSVENAKSMVKIIAVGSTAAATEAVECTTETVSLTHGESFHCDYVAVEGYYLKSGSTHYQYSNVAQSYTTAYAVDCVFAKIVATIGESNYDSIQAAIEALVDGETTLADITVVDKTATLPEGYEDYKIDEDGKIVLDIPSKPTVIVTKTTVEGLHAAYTYTFGELTQEQKDYYGDWTADYIVSFNNAVAADTVVLSGQYDGNGEEWVNLTLGAKGAKDEFGLIAAALEQTGWTGVTVNFTFLLENVGTFNCGIKNLSKDNEGTEMTVKLVLSKDGETIVIGDEDGVKYTIDATAVQGPQSWEETTPSEVIELPEGATTTVTATEIATWAAKNGVAFEAGITVPVNALIFNVAPDAVPEDPEAAVAEILEDLAIDVESLIKNGLSAEALAQLAEDYPMATFELVPVEALPDTANAKFRKLKVELK